MKQHITKEQVMELSPAAQQRLASWFRKSIEYDDDLVRVYIPEEDGALTLIDNKEDTQRSGVFEGHWDKEFDFNMPFDGEYMDPGYTCKLLSHQGTVLPLLDIGQMIELLNENDLVFEINTDTTTCDQLWRLVKYLLEDDIMVS